jgi:hypothetical protein
MKMATLNLFPAHVEFVDDSRKLTPEAYRCLQMLYGRVGGAYGDQGVDVFNDVSGSFGDVAINSTEIITQPADIVIQSTNSVNISPDITQPVDSTQFAEMVFQQDSSCSPILSISPGASPYAYTATREGVLTTLAGTVSVKTFTRSGTTISLNVTDNVIPMQTGDTVTITYAVAPTYKFISR